jgi:hypothetical protein
MLSTAIEVRVVLAAPLQGDRVSVLRDWLHRAAGGALRPSRVGPYEPLRSSFEEISAQQWSDWLNSYEHKAEGGALTYSGAAMFARRGKDSKGSGSAQNLPPIYPFRSFLELTLAVGSDEVVSTAAAVAEDLVELSRDLRAEFAMVSSHEDYEAQNHLVKREGLSTFSTYIGRELREGIPGFYWFNVWPVRASALADRAASAPRVRVEQQSTHIILMRQRSVTELATPEAQTELGEIKRLIGERRFASPTSPTSSADPFRLEE